MDRKSDASGFYKVNEAVALNKDNDALKAYKKRKLKETQIDKVQIELSSLKSDVEEIKALIKGMIK